MKKNAKKNLIPVTLLTGYLGAGKTTVLNHVLSNQKGYKVAVIVNDIGSVNIDASLIEHGGSIVEEDVVPLQNGCICCTLKKNLIDQIVSIAAQKRFDYILIEASGICEPIPIAQTIEALEGRMGIPDMPTVCRLDNIVAVVDASRLVAEFGSGKDLLKDNIEEDDIENLLIQQIEFCDTILINKCDLVDRKQLDEVEAIVRKLQTNAKLIETTKGVVDLKQILDTHAFDFEKVYNSAGWIEEINNPEEAHEGGEVEEYNISTFVFTARKPFDRDKLDEFAGNWPKGVIRAKGIIWFSDENDNAYLLEQAGKQLSATLYGQWMATASEEEIELAKRRDKEFARNWDPKVGDRDIRLVFIGKDMDRKAIESALTKCLVEPDL